MLGSDCHFDGDLLPWEIAAGLNGSNVAQQISRELPVLTIKP